MNRDAGMKFSDPIATRRLITLNNRTWRLAELGAAGYPTLTAYLRHLICRGLGQDLGLHIRDDLEDFEAWRIDWQIQNGMPDWIKDEIRAILAHNGREWPERTDQK